MLLVIDVGNSHTVTGLYEGDKLRGQWRLKSDRAKTDDEIGVHYHSLFSMTGIDTREVSGVVLASVVPSLESAWVSCCSKYFFTHLQKKIFVVSADSVQDMICIRLPNPGEVGADRLVNGIAAFRRFKKPVVVIDFGTAITFDCVSGSCEYLGGAILPGIAISLDALSSRTAKLPQIDISKKPASAIGKSTVEAMTSGIVYGYGGMIDGVIQRIRKEMTGSENGDMEVVATGGMASIIAPATQSIQHVDPLLTLEGLKIIFNQKVGG